jgi:hypothetical protein
MKKPMSEETKAREAAHWTELKKALSSNPVKVCRK